MEPKNLIKYRLTAAGKALLPANEGERGKKIIIPQSDQGDPYFECLAKNLADYHAKELLARKDGRGAKYVALKTVKKEEKGGNSEPNTSKK